MTLLQKTLTYEASIGEREANALADIRHVYEIWGLRLNERNHRISIDYDASRLQESDIASMVRNVGIPLVNLVGNAPTPNREEMTARV